MKKITNLLLLSSAIYLAVVLIVSIVLTNQKSFTFLTNLFFADSLDIKIQDSRWHPTNPFLHLESFILGSDIEYLMLEDIKIHFSLLYPFSSSILSKIEINKTTFIYEDDTESNKEISNLNLFNSFFSSINLKKFTIQDSDFTELFSGSLESSLSLKSPYLKLIGKDGFDGRFQITLISTENSNGNLINDHVTSTNFRVNNALAKHFCSKCDHNLILTTDSKFSLFNNKLIDLYGNLDFLLEKEVFGISAASASFKLIDSEQKMVQVGSFLNLDKDLVLPDFLLSLNKQNLEINIPKVDIGNFNSLTELSRFNNLGLNSLSGTVHKILIRPYELDNFFRASFKNIDIENTSFDIKGLQGNFSYQSNNLYINFDSPYVALDSKNLFDSILDLYDFRSRLSVGFIDGSFQVFSSPVSFIFNNEILLGSFSFDSSPQNSIGDISLLLSSKKISKDSAFLLFPNTFYLNPTKTYLEDLITCGSINNPMLLLRLPIDRRYEFSSASFSLIGASSDLCANIYGFDLDSIEIDFSMQDFIFEGKVEESNFYGSKLKTNLSITNDKNYMFEVEGKIEGPFSSLLRFINNDDIYLDAVTGTHQTNFLYSSPWSKMNSLLDNESKLIINSEVQQAGLVFEQFNYSFKNIFSSVNYDSSLGIKDGFISLKLNNIPLVFDLDKQASEAKPSISIFSVNEIINLKKLFPEPLGSKIKGNSLAEIRIEVPSYLRGVKIAKPRVLFSSNLNGVRIDLPKPFNKAKQDETELDLIYTPGFNKSLSRVNFKFGNILRGKLDFSSSLEQGFIIAGKKKQSISIEEGILSLIGSFDEFDYKILQLLDLTQDSQTIDFTIKDLKIGRLIFSDTYFEGVDIKSVRSNEYNAFEISNSSFKGIFSSPKFSNKIPLLNFDFIDLEFSDDNSSGSFLSIYNNINTQIRFDAKEIILNSENYGNWSFDLIPGKDELTLSNLSGKYNKWGLTSNRDQISDLVISKKGLGWRTDLVTKVYSGSPEKAFKQIGVETNFEMDTFNMEADVTWNSLPWNFDPVEVNGQIELDINGLLIQDRDDIQTPNNLLRLINIFNVTDSFEKVTNLDFRKLYKSGFGADSVKGSLELIDNNIIIKDPLIFKSGSSEFKWTGQIKKSDKGSLDEIDLEVVMTLPLKEYLPAYALILGGPVTAGVVYIAGKAFQRNLDQLSSGKWFIKGTLKEPKTDFEGWFEK